MRMRFEDVYVTGVGVQLGLQVWTSAMVRRGALAMADARSTRQRSVCVASESGPELAASAAKKAVRTHEQMTGSSPAIGAHLHAQMFDKPDFWSSACFVLGQLGVAGCGVSCEIGAMSNGGVVGMEIAASLLGAQSGMHTALISVGDRFGGDRFGWYRAEPGVLYGDAGAALLISRRLGFARIVSAVTCTDPALEGLTRGTPPSTFSSVSTPSSSADTRGVSGVPSPRSAVEGPVIDVRGRQRAWFHRNGGPGEALRRNRAGVTAAMRLALNDAAITLDQARWILLPFLGYEAVRARWYRPLGISDEQTNRTLSLLGLHLGHLGAADHIVGLRHLLATGAIEPGDYVVMASSGAGMSWTTVVLQITDSVNNAIRGPSD
jgi:3-oxoacyl-[acyl-carrier-protein] synthase-3